MTKKINEARMSDVFEYVKDVDTTLEVDGDDLIIRVPYIPGDAQAVIDDLTPMLMVTPDDIERLSQYIERYFPNGCYGLDCDDCPLDDVLNYWDHGLCNYLANKVDTE